MTEVNIGNCRLIHGDCLEVMAVLGKVDCVITDPPYFGVKGESWDNQWKTDSEFLDWMARVVELLAGAMKSNASLYLFASPQMAGRVESVIWKHLNVLGHIVWRKGKAHRTTTGWHQKAEKEAMRSYLFETERVVFAEQFNSDNAALGEASYVGKCDELRGFVFEPLRAYLAAEFSAMGWNGDRLNEICGTASMAARHYVARSQWCLPTKEHYTKLQAAASGHLRREYEDLRREYEDLRRPFNLTKQDQWSDIWEFDPVANYGGKHVCEKPQALLSHMLTASTKPGAIVLDAFSGSGSLALACMSLGRKYIGIEKDKFWFDYACRRIEQAHAQGQLFEPEQPKQVQEVLYG